MSVTTCMDGDSTNVCVEASGEGACCGYAKVITPPANPSFSDKKVIQRLADAGVPTTLEDPGVNFCFNAKQVSEITAENTRADNGFVWAAYCTKVKEEPKEEDSTGAMAKASIAVAAVASVMMAGSF